MKKLLLPLLLLTPFAFSDSEKIQVIDYDSDTKITVYCINNYVFTQYDKTALVQVMMFGRLGYAHPMTCEYYKD